MPFLFQPPLKVLRVGLKLLKLLKKGKIRIFHEKLPYGTRFARDILTSFHSVLGAVFGLLLSRIQKSKSKNGFASLIELFLLASLGLGA